MRRLAWISGSAGITSACISAKAFARLTHLSIKTLRYYHEIGLLEPAAVDPDSGYRRPGQAQDAQLVRRFRDLGMPVADVKAVLVAPGLAARDAILAGHLDRLREQLRHTEAAVDSLRRMLDDTWAPADGTGPVREVYLTDPLDTPDRTQWRTEVCWPLAPARLPGGLEGLADLRDRGTRVEQARRAAAG